MLKESRHRMCASPVALLGSLSVALRLPLSMPSVAASTAVLGLRSPIAARLRFRFCLTVWISLVAFQYGGGVREGMSPGDFIPWMIPYLMRAVVISMSWPIHDWLFTVSQT